MITKEEVILLSTYSKSELVGGLILGDCALRCSDNELRAKLTYHAAEEMNHAAYLAGALIKFGYAPIEVHDPSGEQYYARAGKPKNEVEVLAMAEAFEPIALHHYKAHTQVDGVDEVIVDTLNRIIQEEDHVSWVTQWLNNYQDKNIVEEARKRYTSIIQEVYENELKRLEKSGGMLARIAVASRQLQENESRS
jgi:rubrerythrin